MSTIKSILLLIGLLLSSSTVALAQTGQTGQPTTGLSPADVLREEQMSDAERELGGEVEPIELPVDPQYYHVGPNDKLLLATSGVFTRPISLTIGIDNRIALPRGLGIVDAGGLTLAELELKLDSIFRQRSAWFGDIELALMRARPIFVTVSGNVIAPGRYIANSSDRVTTVIDLANRVPEGLAAYDEELMELSKERVVARSQYGSRDLGSGTGGDSPVRIVAIRHADGSSSIADLVRFRATGEPQFNPALREGDLVIVEHPDPFGPTISVSGAVHAPVSSIPYRPGDNALMLLRLAGGLRDDAMPGSAFLVRYVPSGEQEISVDVSDTSSLAATLLEPGDQLVIPSRPRNPGRRSGVVAVIGEVVRPQTYTIVPGETKLSDVIARAGGFTSYASLNGSYIRRPSDAMSLRPKQQLLDPRAGMATSPLTLEDTTRYKFDVQLQQNMVSADFVGIFRQNRSDRDVILQSGDEIIVPRDPGAVYVAGRVQYPGWVSFKPGADYEYYIERAGGFTAAAAPGRVAVEKFGTGVWDGVCCTEIQPGDRIYVPAPRDTPARTALEQTSTILFIISSVAGLISTFIRIYQDLSTE